MTEILDNLSRRYKSETPKKVSSNSWIPTRPNGSDPKEMLRRQINKDQPDKEKTINNEEFITPIREDIFEQVGVYLLEEHGEEKFAEKWEHFNESWTKFFDRYGNLLILALGELTDEIDFLNKEGFIDKFKACKQMESVAKRLGV